MAMDLTGAGGEFSWDVFSWGRLLRLAEKYGWQPAGTQMFVEEIPFLIDRHWHGGYDSNDYQIVGEEDARNLADALERAIPDIPEEDVLSPIREESGGIRIAPDPPEVSDRDWFCGAESKTYLQDFIRYCR